MHKRFAFQKNYSTRCIKYQINALGNFTEYKFQHLYYIQYGQDLLDMWYVTLLKIKQHNYCVSCLKLAILKYEKFALLFFLSFIYIAILQRLPFTVFCLLYSRWKKSISFSFCAGSEDVNNFFDSKTSTKSTWEQSKDNVLSLEQSKEIIERRETNR